MILKAFSFLCAQMNRFLIGLLVVVLLVASLREHVTEATAKRDRCPNNTGPCYQCLIKCKDCIEMWGKRHFSGPLCRDDCVATDGDSMQENLECDNPKYVITRDNGSARKPRN